MSKSKKRPLKSSFPLGAPLTFGAASAKQVAQSTVKEIPVLDEQLNRLTGAAENVEHQARRLHELADRLFGIVGVEGQSGAPTPAPVSSIGKLNEAHERLDQARVSLTAAVNRLEAL